MTLLIKNANVLEQGLVDVLIEEDKIKAIGTELDSTNMEVVDAKGQFLFPGLLIFMFIYVNQVVNQRRQLSLVQ